MLRGESHEQEETSVSPWVWSWNIQTNQPQIHHSLSEPNACVGWQHRAWPCLFHCSVAQSCQTLCNPRDCGTPGFPVLHYRLEFAQTHVHWVSDAIQPSHPLSSPSSSALNLSSIRVFSNESTLRIRWPKYWNFNFSISPSNECSGLISFRMDWFDLLAVQETLKSLLQHHSLKAM